MTKYRKKPVVIEAVLFNGDNHVEICDKWSNNVVKRCKHRDFLEIPTLEGHMIANQGDYIIKGIQGEFYPCKPDIFKESYELVVKENDE